MTPEEQPDTPTALPAHVYATRRRNAFFALVGVGVLVWLVVLPKGNGTTIGAPANTGATTNPNATAQAATEPTAKNTVPDQVQGFTLSMTDMNAAVAHYSATRTFDGYQPAEGGTVRWAHNGATAAFSREMSSGTCFMYAVKNAKPTLVKQDPTARACDANEVRNAVRTP